MHNKKNQSTNNEYRIVKNYKLANQGDAKAQYNLGLMYNHGEGVAKDQKEAVRWFRLSAAQDNLDAQSALGWMYKKGRGVEKDEKEASRLFHYVAQKIQREDGQPISLSDIKQLIDSDDYFIPEELPPPAPTIQNDTTTRTAIGSTLKFFRFGLFAVPIPKNMSVDIEKVYSHRVPDSFQQIKISHLLLQ